MKRKHRILWVSISCLLDTTSGAAIATLTLLQQLKKSGAYDIDIVCATTFDNPNGISLIESSWEKIKSSTNKFVNINIDDLIHRLTITSDTDFYKLKYEEFEAWYTLYVNRLDEFKPDIVLFYGGRMPELLIADEAKYRGIPTVFHLCNSSYKGTRWQRDVDLIFTDSAATAELYKKREGLNVFPIGSLIDPSRIKVGFNSRKYFTCINPLPEKGGIIVLQVIVSLLSTRPDIKFEIVESRGSWNELVKNYFHSIGKDTIKLPNVKVTKNTPDMRDVYSRSKLVVAPSLIWESGGRVVAEAMINAIPVLITNRGGLPEFAGDACIKVEIPDIFCDPPYNKTLSIDSVNAICQLLIILNDNNCYYEELCQKAIDIANRTHNLNSNVKKFENLIAPLLSVAAGDKR